MPNERDKAARMISLAFLICAVSMFVYFSATKFNPDTDVFWLIETGRYIANNGIPKTNPWTYADNLEIIVQQPLCALLNFGWWQLGGLSVMWQLASIENMILVLMMLLYTKLFSNERSQIFSAVALMELVVSLSGIGSTRPYQLTVSNMFLLMYMLEKARRKDSMISVYVSVILTTLFQTNYQMASVLIIPCFLTVYSLGTAFNRLKDGKEVRISRIVSWFFVYGIWFIVSLFNPYGLRGIKYLLLSKNALSLVGNKIVEMTRPTILSPSGLLIIAVIFFCVHRYIKDKQLDWCELFLIAGASFASILAIRNMWMLIIAFCMSYGKNIPSTSESPVVEKLKCIRIRIFNEVLHCPVNTVEDGFTNPFLKIIFSHGLLIASVVIFVGVTCLSPRLSIKNTDSYNSIFNMFDTVPADAKIYTSFNTGSYLEYLGRKIYVDARPELYAKEITMSQDILKEWYSLEWQNLNFEEYVDKSDWEYYFVTKNTPISFYLSYSGKADLIGEENGQQLFKISSSNKE